MKGMSRYQIKLFNVLFSSVVESKLFIPVTTLESTGSCSGSDVII
jgi:hypothetical protein